MGKDDVRGMRKPALFLCLCLGCLLAYHTLFLRLLLTVWSEFHTCKLRVDEYASAILAYDDLLVHLDVELSLWRYLVEASSTRVTLHVDDTESVTHILAYALEALQQTWLNAHLKVLGLLTQLLFLCTCLFAQSDPSVSGWICKLYLPQPACPCIQSDTSVSGWITT